MTTYPTTTLTHAAITDLAWLGGIWSGQRNGDRIEEYWSNVAGDTLMGMFRWLKAGQLHLYELIAIEQEGEEIVCRIKHFGRGLIGWEEKNEAVTFKLVRLRQQEAVFLQQNVAEPSWMVYQRPDVDELVAFFVRPGQTPAPHEAFRFTRR